MVLKKDMEVELEDSEEEMYKEKTHREPAEPVMKGSERNLPLHKNIPVVLFDERGDKKEEEKYSANNTRPPDEVVTENGGRNLS
jgi:hypothetical protein